MYRYLPPATQVVLISATLPHEILEMTNKFMTDPIRILVKRSVGHAHRLCWGGWLGGLRNPAGGSADTSLSLRVLVPLLPCLTPPPQR